MFAFAVLRPALPFPLPPPLFLDQTEDQRAEKSFWSLPPPPPPSPALSQSLDPALLGDRSNWPGVILFFHSR